MRAWFVATLCLGSILGQAALADPAQPESTAAPAMSPVPGTTAGTAATPATVAPSATVVPPAAAQAGAAPAMASTTSAVNLDEIVCRVTPPPTGSRFGGGRECHTVRQWNQREKDSQDVLNREQHMGAAGMPGN